jgi:hypothetical protein
VALDPDPEPLRQAVDRPLEPGVVERHEPAAPVAYQVVMVVAARVGGLESSLSVADVHALDQPVLDQ